MIACAMYAWTRLAGVCALAMLLMTPQPENREALKQQGTTCNHMVPDWGRIETVSPHLQAG